MHTVERRIRNAKDEATRRKWIYAGCYFAICYVDSLRGSEGLLLDLEGIRDHFETGLDEDYVVIALLGTVKGEHQTRQHLLPTASVTRSGICVRKWIRRVIAANYAEGRTTGPALCDPNGRVLTSHAMDELFHEALCEVFDYNPALFLADIRCHQDIYEKYGVFRSFRRGSDSRAIDMEVKSIDIDVVNRWTKKEKAGTRRPGHQMRHHYADINLLLQPFLRYTRNM